MVVPVVKNLMLAFVKETKRREMFRELMGGFKPNNQKSSAHLKMPKALRLYLKMRESLKF